MCRPVMQTVCQGCETITAHEAELLKSIGTMGWAAWMKAEHKYFWLKQTDQGMFVLNFKKNLFIYGCAGLSLLR